ncbi:MAG: hypothetical protein AAFR38_07435 [Planctomycetota bacterium]
MRTTATIAAIAALTAPAAAQVTISLSGPATFNQGETITLTASATSTVNNVGTTGFAVRIIRGATFVPGSIFDLLNPISPPGGFIVVSESSSEIVVENFVAFFGSFGGNEGIGASGPQGLFSFQVTIDADNLEPWIDLETSVSDQSLATGANDAGFIATNFDVQFGSFSAGFIPAPGTAGAGALALVGLAAARRRR